MNLDRVKTPAEKVIEVDLILLTFNFEQFLKSGQRIVRLACGHLHLTRSREKAICPRCTEMLRRSVKDGSEDYETFRHSNGPDRMNWPSDPLAIVNQPREYR